MGRRRARRPTPEDFRQLLGCDRIAPIYHPVIVDTDEVDWHGDTLVPQMALEQSAAVGGCHYHAEY